MGIRALLLFFLNLFSPALNLPPQSVLGETTTNDPIYFTVNVPATFNKDISAPNMVYLLKAGSGITVSEGQTPTISNTGILTLEAGSGISVDGNKITNTLTQGLTSLSAGGGISVDGNKITNTLTQGLTSLTAGIGISVSGSTITNTGILSLVAGTGIGVSGSTITNTLTPDYTLSGWTDNGTTVSLTNSSDTVSFGGGGITNAGAITGATGLTSSGQITFSAFSTGILHTNYSGVLSVSAIGLGGSDVSGTLSVLNGGIGITGVNTGDMLYASTTNTISRLGIGSSGQVLIVTGGAPTWGSITGGSGGICTDCLVSDPGSNQTITPSSSTAVGLIVKQASGGSVDVFRVESNDGNTTYLRVDSSGNVQLGSGGQTTAGILTVSPTNTDPIAISPVAVGSSSYTGTITSSDLTQARIWTFPDLSGIVCTTAGNCTGTSSSVGGNGNSNYLSKWQSTYSLTDSLLYDDGTNIGIGTTAPGFKIDVNGTGRILGATTFGSSIGVTGAVTLASTLDLTGAANFLSTLGVSGATTLSSTLDITSNTTIGGSLKVNGTGTHYLMGNVGIGTTAPGYKLEVNGDALISTRLGIGSTNGLYALNVGNTANFNNLFASGNVGIGTTAPSSLLELASSVTDSSDMFALTNTDTGGAANKSTGILFRATNNNSALGTVTIAQIKTQTHAYNVSDGTSDLIFLTHNDDRTLTEKMRIYGNGGFVGIGTTSPDRLFHAEAADAVTNAITYTNRSSHITSGTAANSFGIGEEWELENASGTNRIGATQEYTFSDATDATEDVSWALKLIKAGTLTNQLALTSAGVLTVGTPTSNIGEAVLNTLTLSSNSSSGNSISAGSGLTYVTTGTSGHYFQPKNTTVATITIDVAAPPVSGAITSTSGTSLAIKNSASFAPTSGTATMAYESISPIINQTGGANGISRGLYINPTLTSAADWRSIEVVSGNVLFGTTSGSVGIGTTAPSVKLDLAGTSGTDAFRLTNAGAKVLGLSYGTNNIAMTTASTDPTNKLTNGTFDSDLTSWSESANTLYDQFSTAKTPTELDLDNTTAEPTGGVRTVTDTNDVLSITAGGVLNFATGGPSGGTLDPGVWYSSSARAAGKVATTKLNITSGVARFGWGVFSGEGITDGGLNFNGSIYDFNTQVAGTFSAGTDYYVADVLRSPGGHYMFIKGGTYTNWTLLDAKTTGTTASMYPTIHTAYGGVFTADNIRIPTSTWLPTPLAYDTFTRADGAIGTGETTGPDSQTTPSLAWTGGAISSNKNVITPSLGSEVMVNGGFDSDTDWTKGTGWTIGSGVATAADSTTTSLINTSTTLSNSTWYLGQVDITRTANNLTFYVSGNNGSFVSPTIATTGTFYTSGRSASSNPGRNGFYGNYFSGTVDNFSVKPLTLSSLFSSVSTSDSDVIADANVTLTAGTQAGLVLNLDSTSSPANFIIVYHDGTSVKVDEAVAGVYTNKQTTTVTYSAGATLRAIRQGTKLRVYYNNALVGSELTMTANTNTNHGLFSTYSGNSFDNFVLWPRGSSTTKFTDAPFEELVATRNTSTTYNNSTASVQLVTSGTDANYLQSANVGDTSTYNLIAYAYTTGAAVTAADLSLYYDTATLTTTYTAMGGTGWYKLTGTLTGVASAKNYGVRVKTGKTVYIDEMHLQVGTATAQTMYVMDTNTGVMGLNVQGLVNGTQNGIATLSVGGTISDANFTNPVDGLIGIDTTNHRIYFREGGAWSYAAKAGGFQIPNYEATGLTNGDFLMPYVESIMSDGALHGLYQKFDLNKILAIPGAIIFSDDVTFNKKVTFDKDMAGVATITALTNQVDVKFTNTYLSPPIINFSLVADTDEVTYIEDGHKAYLSHVTLGGFSITLPTLAIRDFSFNWIAISTSEANITKSDAPFPTSEPTPTIEITPTLIPTIILTPTQVASPSATPTVDEVTPTP